MAKGKTVNKISFDSILVEDYKEIYEQQVLKILEENFKHPWSKQLINNMHNFSYKKVYILNGEVIAFLDANIILDEAEILMIAVKKIFQGIGLGKFILNNFLQVLKNKNVKTVYLDVADDNIKAINLYKSAGFDEYSKRKNYYKDDKDAVLMKKNIT